MPGPRLRLDDVFGPGGLLDRQLSSYEFRSSQLAMAQAVEEAVRTRSHLCVEAGTGTGKTLAYLIPALLSGKRVLVSTATRNLQDQIFHKDLPFLRKHLLPSLTATYLKGRPNYLCLRRYRDERRQLVFAGFQPEEVGWVDKWLAETRTGDRAELPWLRDDHSWWDRIDARSDTCSGQKCSHFEECFITRMRQEAFAADIVVVNHALFFANLALEMDELGRILPDVGVVILDEAHELEDIASDHFGQRMSSFQVEDLRRTLLKAPAGETLIRAAERLESVAFRFFAALPPLEGRFSLTRYRDGAGRTLDLRGELDGPAGDLIRQLVLLKEMVNIHLEEWAEREAVERRILKLVAALEKLVGDDDAETVYWFERTPRGVFINLSPIDVAPILSKSLFARHDTVVLTSATLTTGRDFEYFRQRVGVERASEIRVPGEFDYAKQAVLYVPRHLPDPRNHGAASVLVPEFTRLLELTDGHAFLLFTSFQMLDRIHGELLQRTGYPLLRQGEKPKQVLLEEFRDTPRAVLCATASFWQGIDVQGDALRLVVVDKLPFRVPTEPLVAARVDRLERLGLNGFTDYTLPSAIITLRQGLGRLIRSRTDTGILAVLDSRLWTKNYGRAFLDSLPNCPVADNMGTLENLFRQIGSRNLEG